MITFDEISKDIIKNKKYKYLVTQDHHGINRYEHSIRVAKRIYNITKKLKLDYVSATRAALLHDFFFDDELENLKSFEKIKKHPEMALNNSMKHFDLNEKEKDAILNHMFPITTKRPKSIEGILLILVDNNVSIKECSKYKVSQTLTLMVIFIFNFILFSNK